MTKQPTIKIGGQEIATEMADCVLDLMVDTSLHMPDMCALHLHSTELKWVDDTSLAIGKEIEVLVGESVLFKGEITALEPEFEDTGRATLGIRAYDKSHRLHLGRQIRTFQSQKDSDIVRTLAGEAGLSAEVDPTTTTHDYVLQNNQSNMEFLLARAERSGYQVYCAEGKLYFKKGDWIRGTGPELTWGDTLHSFRLRHSTAHQAKTAVAQSWDANSKEKIESVVVQPSSLNQGGMTKTGGDTAHAAFGEAKEIVVDQVLATVDEAKALAAGLANDLARDFVQAEGACMGNPTVKAGYKITIKEVGDRFSGSYYVSTATHIFQSSGGTYETRFTVSGRQPQTLSHLLDRGDGKDQAQGRLKGVVPAIVTNLSDPDNLGRVRVKYPWLGDEIESWWIRIATPMAGAERGLMYLPEVNDEVLVAFEHGDANHPYIVGALWNNTDKPPKQNSEAVASGKVNLRTLKTRCGHLIVLDDSEGKEQISVTSKSGHTVILDDTNGSEKITVKDKTGNNKMVIDSASNSMKIDVNGDFVVNAKGKITMNSTQDMSLESKANAKVKGTQLGLEGSAKSELKGPMVSVNGSAQTEVKGSIMVQIQGGVVKIN